MTEKKQFNVEAYERVVFLTIDKMRRKKQVLSEKEQKELDELKKVVLKQEGKKALKTNTYKVGSKLVRLVEGVPVPKSVFDSFSEYAKKKLFV